MMGIGRPSGVVDMTMQKVVALSVLALLVPFASQSQTPPPLRVPLRTGLTIVTALNEPDKGDYESIKRFLDVNDKAARMRYSAEVRDTGDDNPLAALLGGGGRSKPPATPGTESTRTVNAMRSISRADLETAGDYRWLFSEQMPESLPGSTAVGVSRRVLTELKANGQTTLRVPASGIAGALGNLLNGILGSRDVDEATLLSGTLKRVEPAAVPFKVILNDEPVELMAIHARGLLGDEDAEFWILDDGDNPLALKWQFGETRLQVIKLMFPVAPERSLTDGGGAGKPGTGQAGGGGTGSAAASATNAAAGTAKRIEEDLAKEGRAIVYGIYFDFASDRIKEESEPVLAEIAQVLRQNATWNLSVEGHTDNIGGDPYNLDLSKRRSAAVKLALTSRYGIGANRLQTTGFGASSPKDRNDTMEGRARNRRVELVKR